MNKPSFKIINFSVGITMLTLFFIIIVMGYIYVDESRRNNREAKEAIEVVNKTQAEFLAQWNQKQIIDNVRFNKTLQGLAETYNLILGNQKLIIELSSKGSTNLQNNLNLTKFNRAALLDSNIMIHKLWENLTGIDPCKDNKLSSCIDPNMNITMLVTNSSPSINEPRPAAPNG